MDPVTEEQKSTLRHKTTLRQKILANRDSLSDEVRRWYDTALITHCRQWLRDVLAECNNPTICAYVPAGTEPGASLQQQFLDDLASAVEGTKMMLPICPPGPPSALDWAAYTGELITARYGLKEPSISPKNPAISPLALDDVDAIVLPALATDPRTGMRLGRGAGYYDRSLEFLQAPTAVLVFPEELIDGLPYEAHDRPVDAIIDATGVHFPMS